MASRLAQQPAWPTIAGRRPCSCPQGRGAVCAGRKYWKPKSEPLAACQAQDPGAVNSAADTSHAATIPKRKLLQGMAAVPLVMTTASAFAAEPGDPPKLKNLPIEEVTDRLKRSLIENQYYVSGKVPREIFDDQCVFSDPTQRTQGIYWYSRAVPALFNPAKSRIDVIDIRARDAKTIDLKWRLEAQLNVPGLRFNIKPYTGSTVYKTNDDGLINQQKESWDISIVDAFLSTFFPNFGAPPAPPIEALQRQQKPI